MTIKNLELFKKNKKKKDNFIVICFFYPFFLFRNYPRVTNSSLIHLALNASRLEYLDVTGTSVTKDGIESFKSQKSNVKVVSSFDET